MNEAMKTRCLQLYRALEEDRHGSSRYPLHEVLEELGPLESPALCSGQIWAAFPGGDHDLATLVLLTGSLEGLRGILVTDETCIAANDDIIVPANNSPTGEELLLCSWSEAPVPRSALKHFVGNIDQDLVETLRMMLRRQSAGGYRLRRVVHEDTPKAYTEIKWEISSISNPNENAVFRSGPRILADDDPRLLVRRALEDGTRWLADTVRREQSSEVIGKPVDHSEGSLLARFEAALKSAGFGEGPGVPTQGLPWATAAAAGAALSLSLRTTTAAIVTRASKSAVGLSPGSAAAAIRPIAGGKGTKQTRWKLKIGDVDIAVVFGVMEGQFRILASALRDNRPFKGFPLQLKPLRNGHPIEQVTDKNGQATLEVEDTDDEFTGTLTLGKGPNKRVLQF